MDQTDLFRLIDPSKFRFSPLLQQIRLRCMTLAELCEEMILSELLLIEEQSIRNLVDMMNEPNGYKSIPSIDFHPRVFEVAMNFEEECSRL
jgi:hypothetical protein